VEELEHHTEVEHQHKQIPKRCMRWSHSSHAFMERKQASSNIHERFPPNNRKLPRKLINVSQERILQGRPQNPPHVSHQSFINCPIDPMNARFMPFCRVQWAGLAIFHLDDEWMISEPRGWRNVESVPTLTFLFSGN
jgi:hypothetical protein